MTNTPGTSPRNGRRRDPSVDEAIIEGARAVFRRVGWAGFNFDVVAREAGVGKSALYRRWPSKEDLVIEALRVARPPSASDKGSFRADLLDLARRNAEWWLNGDGVLNQRVLTERLANPEFTELLDRSYMGDQMAGMRQIAIRAIERGEARADISPSMVAELLAAIRVHVTFTTKSNRKRMADSIDNYVAELVEVIIRGCAPDIEQT